MIKKIFLASIFSSLFCLKGFCGGEKAIKVPYFPDVKIKNNGIPSEPFWEKAAVISKFQKVFVGGDYGKGTEVRICRDDKNLYIAATIDAPLGTCVAEEGKGCWSGDNIEVFIAGRTKHGWNLAQAVLGSNGSVYSERLTDEQWTGFRYTSEYKWSAKLIIPFEALRLDENKLYFNILNRRLNEKTTLSWVTLPRFAHEPDCFVKLDFITPDDIVTHGPWTFEIKQDQAGIAWESAAPCRGKITIYPKGEPEKAVTVNTNDQGGAVSRNKDLHSAVIKKLLPDTEYVYTIDDGNEYSFRTLAEKSADFSFAVTGDIHSHSEILDTMFQRSDINDCDLFFAIGDILSASLGREALYEGFLDSMVKYCKMPFYVIRGNHEYRGPCPEIMFECFRDGKIQDYTAFSHKGVFFVTLDGDGDGGTSEEYLEKEAKWLQKVVKSPEFINAEYRVLITHVPLCFDHPLYSSKELHSVLGSISKEDLARFDLAIAGHMHEWGKVYSGEKNFSSANPAKNGIPLIQLPFPTFINGAGTAMIFRKSAKGLTLEISEADGRKIETLQIPSKK